MSVGSAAFVRLRRSSRIQRSLKPRLGTTILLAMVVVVITVADFSFAALGIIAQTVVGIDALFTTGLLTLDVAFFATGLLTLDVAFLTTGLLTLDVALLTTGLLTLDVAFFATGLLAMTRTVLDAVRRGVSSLVADSAGLVQERWTDDFSFGSGLVFDVVAGVFRFGEACIMADFAVGSSGLGGGGGIERL